MKLKRMALTTVAVVLIPATAISLGWMVFTRSDWYQIDRVLTDGPATAAAVRGSDGWEAVGTWAEAQGQLGRLDDALSVARHPSASLQLSKASVEATILGKTARGLGDAGYTDDAKKVAEDALAAAQRIPPEEINTQIGVLEDAGQVLAQSGETKEATKALGKALAAARQIHDYDRQAGEVAEVAEAMAAAGHLEDAKRVCESALSAPPAKESYSYTQSFHLSRVAEALARAGHFEDALALSRRIDQKYRFAHGARLYGIEATSYVAQLWSQAGKVDQAKRVWDEAHSAAGHIEDPYSRALALALVGRTLARAGKLREADAVLTEALEAARQSQTGPSAALDLSDVATALAERGKLSDALPLARQSGYPVDALSRVAEVLARTGRSNEAKTVWDEAHATALRSDQRLRSNALVSVARVAARLHLYREARLAAESSTSSRKLNVYAAILSEYASENNPMLRQRLEIAE